MNEFYISQRVRVKTNGQLGEIVGPVPRDPNDDYYVQLDNDVGLIFSDPPRLFRSDEIEPM